MASDSIHVRILCGTLRRPLLLAIALGLVAATSASAALTPVRRPTSETGTLPRLRAGTLVVPSGHATSQTRVIVRLSAPPLAAWNAQRTLASAAHLQHLNVHSASSQAYVAQLR